IGIHFISDTQFEIVTDFATSTRQVQRYADKAKYNVKVSQGAFRQTFSLGQTIDLPFFNATITQRPGKLIPVNTKFFVQFLNFDSVVYQYQSGVKIAPFSGSSSSV